MAKMDDTELAGLLSNWIADARQFDKSDLAEHRKLAIDFYDGRVDIPHRPNRSQVVSSDVADALEWILPGIMRVFGATNRIAVYEPEKPEEEEGAKQATFTVNHIFLNECDGYRALLYAFHDGLLHGNGILKAWWEGKPKYETETLRGLNEEEYMAIISEPDVEEVLEVTEYLVGPDGEPIDMDDDAENPKETKAEGGKEEGEDAAY